MPKTDRAGESLFFPPVVFRSLAFLGLLRVDPLRPRAVCALHILGLGKNWSWKSRRGYLCDANEYSEDTPVNKRVCLSSYLIDPWLSSPIGSHLFLALSADSSRPCELSHGRGFSSSVCFQGNIRWSQGTSETRAMGFAGVEVWNNFRADKE